MSEQVIKKYIRDNYISKAKIKKTIENYQSQLQLCNKLDARTMISKKGLIIYILGLLNELLEE